MWRLKLKALMGLCGVALIVLQYQYWFGVNGALAVQDLDKALGQARQTNAQLRARNEMLQAEVSNLKTQQAAIEERARTDLGMIKEHESFVHVVSYTPDHGVP